MKNKLVIGLGSNLGNRYAYLLMAIHQIEIAFRSKPVVAHFYETPPWGDENQSKFLNTALYLSTQNSINASFSILKNIEQELGRTKTKRWGPRNIDLDILFYEKTIETTHDLSVPHVNLHKRAFVLVPLCDIIPHFVHPVLQKTMLELKEGIVDDTTLFSKSTVAS